MFHLKSEFLRVVKLVKELALKKKKRYETLSSEQIKINNMEDVNLKNAIELLLETPGDATFSIS